MTRRRIPKSIKQLTGEIRPGRIEPELAYPPLTEIPALPHWLRNPYSITMWNELATTFVATRLLTAPSLGPFGVMCALGGKIISDIDAGIDPNNQMLITFRQYSNDFGMTIASQGKMKQLAEESNGNSTYSNPFLSHTKRPNEVPSAGNSQVQKKEPKRDRVAERLLLDS